MKSYISIFSLLERVPSLPGDCGLYCEIGVIIITEMLTGQCFFSELFFLISHLPPYHATCFENEHRLCLILYSQSISNFLGITLSTPSILQDITKQPERLIQHFEAPLSKMLHYLVSSPLISVHCVLRVRVLLLGYFCFLW